VSDTPEGPGWWMANDLKWYPPGESMQGSAGASDRFAPPPSQVEPVGSDGDLTEHDSVPSGPQPRSLRTLALQLVVAVEVVVLAIIVGLLGMKFLASNDEAENARAISSTTTTAPGDTDATPEADPRLTLRAAAGRDGATVLEADSIEFNGALTGITATRDANSDYMTTGSLQLWSWSDGQWIEGDAITTEFPVESWFVADATGDGVGDLVIELQSGDGPKGIVLTAHSGPWRIPEFEVEGLGTGTFTDSDLGMGPNGLTSFRNPCVPNCAEAPAISQTWTYNSERQVFIGEES
jgi:hypothetical protein